MSFDVNIANMAIGRMGSTQFIANEDEKSPLAKAADQFYDNVRKFCLAQYPWPFAKVYATLQLVATTPNNDWAYSYRYPSDCLNFRKVPTGLYSTLTSNTGNYRNGQHRNERVKEPHTISHDSQGKLIFTDRENAEGIYVKNVENTQLFDPIFTSMLAWRLAMELAPHIQGGDPHGMTKRAYAMYIAESSEAEALNANEENDDKALEAEWIEARGTDHQYTYSYSRAE